MSEGMATPSRTTVPPKPIVEQVGLLFISVGPNCPFRNAVVGEIANESLFVPDPKPLEPQGLLWRSQAHTPEKASGDMTLPSTDLQGALNTLQPQCWLSSTAIELVLSLCSSKSFRVFDPLAYDVGQPEIKNFKSTPSNVQYALLPLYYREHWTLALFNLENHTVTCYDSLPGQNSIAHKDALLKFANYLTVEPFQWTFQYGSQAKQENFYDCGVYLLVTSLHIFAGSTCPLVYDCSLWRALFRALLSVKCQTQLPATKWRLLSSTSIDDENDDPDLIKKTFLSHKQLQEEAKSGAEAASEAIDVLQRLRTINIKLRDDTENDLHVAQTDLTTIDQINSAYRTVRPHVRTNSVARGLQTDRGRAWAEVERLHTVLEATETRILSFEAAIQTAVKIRDYHAEAEAQSRERMECTLQGLDNLHEKQMQATERCALIKEQLSDLLK